MMIYFVEELNKMKMLVELVIIMDICYFFESYFREIF